MCFSDHLYSFLQIFSYINFNILIHAPAKGATQMHFPFPPDTVHFNPRSREGSDELPGKMRIGSLRISIHAPAKGATVKFYKDGHTEINFNPRSREGSDCNTEVFGFSYRDFNPRSREGSDVYIFAVFRHNKNFNPRSREGSDVYDFGDITYNRISIHAPAKGATVSEDCQERIPSIFQSTLPRRERPRNMLSSQG